MDDQRVASADGDECVKHHRAVGRPLFFPRHVMSGVSDAGWGQMKVRRVEELFQHPAHGRLGQVGAFPPPCGDQGAKQRHGEGGHSGTPSFTWRPHGVAWKRPAGKVNFRVTDMGGSLSLLAFLGVGPCASPPLASTLGRSRWGRRNRVCTSRSVCRGPPQVRLLVGV